MKYNWILFDADNTLFDFDRSSKLALELSVKAFGIPFDENIFFLYEKINASCWKKFEEGTLEQEKLKTLRFDLFFEAINQQHDSKKFADTYLDFLATNTFLIDGALDLLNDVKEKFHLAIITNGLKKVQRPRIRQVGLTSYFKEIVVSEEIGHSKPDAAFFDYTFQKINHPAKEKALVIGDSLNSDIRGGNNYQIDTCWFNPKAKENNSGIVPTYVANSFSEIKTILNFEK